VPQPEYPDDVGGRFLQNFGTFQNTAFAVAIVKTRNPTNLLNWDAKYLPPAILPGEYYLV
jgi:hypothetical protein